MTDLKTSDIAGVKDKPEQTAKQSLVASFWFTVMVNTLVTLFIAGNLTSLGIISWTTVGVAYGLAMIIAFWSTIVLFSFRKTKPGCYSSLLLEKETASPGKEVLILSLNAPVTILIGGFYVIAYSIGAVGKMVYFQLAKLVNSVVKACDNLINFFSK